jgi:hypothetical protein
MILMTVGTTFHLCNKTTYYRPRVIFPFYHGYTSTVMEQGIKTGRRMPFPSPKTKHKHEDRTQMIDYIPSDNFHICWTTGNHYCIPLTPNCCKFWKIWTTKI